MDDTEKRLAEIRRDLVTLAAEREHARAHPQAWWIDAERQR